MRSTRAIPNLVVLLALPLLAGECGATEMFLLQKFRQHNDTAREQAKAEIDRVLEEVRTLENEQPELALKIVRDARDKFLARAPTVLKEDKGLTDPLWEKVRALGVAVRVLRAKDLGGAHKDYTDYLGLTDEVFRVMPREAARVSASDVELVEGSPALFAMADGTQSFGILHNAPIATVSCTIASQPHEYGPGVVSGAQTPDGFYVYHRGLGQYLFFSNQQFFVLSSTLYAPAQAPRFWIPSRVPKFRPELLTDYRIAVALVPPVLTKVVGFLVVAWADAPALSKAQRVAEATGPAASRLLRDVLIEAQIRKYYTSATPEKQQRVFNAVLDVIDRRPAEVPLAPDEERRLIYGIAEAFPERRHDASVFVAALSRYYNANLARR
jgi:hypothetical protein